MAVDILHSNAVAGCRCRFRSSFQNNRTQISGIIMYRYRYRGADYWISMNDDDDVYLIFNKILDIAIGQLVCAAKNVIPTYGIEKRCRLKYSLPRFHEVDSVRCERISTYMVPDCLQHINTYIGLTNKILKVMGTLVFSSTWKNKCTYVPTIGIYIWINKTTIIISSSWKSCWVRVCVCFIVVIILFRTEI